MLGDQYHNAYVNSTVTTDLHIATKKGSLKELKSLLKSGADIDSKNEYGRTPLHVAISRDNLKFVKFFLKSEATINSKDIDGSTPLHIAAQKGKIDIVNFLLKSGAGINSKNGYGSTPLHIAANEGHLEIVEVLLGLDASIDSEDQHRRTALHIACKKGHVQIVIALLEYGADINIVCKYNRTPTDYAFFGFRSFSNEDEYEDDDYVRDCGICAYEQIAEILKIHIVKMKTANLKVSERNLRSVSSNGLLRDFQNECEAEVESMKSEKIGNTNVSFYEILTMGEKQLAMYAGKECIVQTFRSDDYEIKFPIYASIINNSFRKGEKVMEQGNEISNFVSTWLPFLCTKHFSCLSDEDF